VAPGKVLKFVIYLQHVSGDKNVAFFKLLLS